MTTVESAEKTTQLQRIDKQIKLKHTLKRSLLLFWRLRTLHSRSSFNYADKPEAYGCMFVLCSSAAPTILQSTKTKKWGGGKTKPTKKSKSTLAFFSVGNLSRQRQFGPQNPNTDKPAQSVAHNHRITIAQFVAQPLYLLLENSVRCVASLKWAAARARSNSDSTQNAWITYSSEVTCNLNEVVSAPSLSLSLARSGPVALGMAGSVGSLACCRIT